MSLIVVTSYDDHVLYISAEEDMHVREYINSGNYQVLTIDSQDTLPDTIGRWRYEYTIYNELSGWIESEDRRVDELENIREVRDIELGKTDWVTIRAAETKEELPEDYLQYREWLRDLPAIYDPVQILTSPVPIVSGSYMDINIIDKLQPWSTINMLSGAANNNPVQVLESRATTTVPVSAQEDIDESPNPDMASDFNVLIQSTRDRSSATTASSASKIVGINPVFDLHDDEISNTNTYVKSISGGWLPVAS